VNGEQIQDCATCGGSHVANDKHVITTPEGARRRYCAECWPEAAGLEALRQMGIAAARQGVVRDHAETVWTLLRDLVYFAPGTNAGRSARELLDKIEAAGEAAGKVGW
jgi:hypothetical protein